MQITNHVLRGDVLVIYLSLVELLQITYLPHECVQYVMAYAPGKRFLHSE